MELWDVIDPPRLVHQDQQALTPHMQFHNEGRERMRFLSVKGTVVGLTAVYESGIMKQMMVHRDDNPTKSERDRYSHIDGYHYFRPTWLYMPLSTGESITELFLRGCEDPTVANGDNMLSVTWGNGLVVSKPRTTSDT